MTKNKRNLFLSFIFSIWISPPLFSFNGPVVGYYGCYEDIYRGIYSVATYPCPSSTIGNYDYLYSDGTYDFGSESGNYTVSGDDVVFTPTKGSNTPTTGHLSTVDGATNMEFDYNLNSGYVYESIAVIYKRFGDIIGNVPLDITGSAGSVSISSSTSNPIPSVPRTPISFTADDFGSSARPDKGVKGHIGFKAPQSGNLNVEVFDPTGGKVFDTADGNNDIPVTAGTTYDIAWDGTIGNLNLANPAANVYTITGGGTNAAPGGYIVRLKGAGITESKKFIIVR